MEKLSIIIVILLSWLIVCENAYSSEAPDSFIVVGISGFGTRRPDQAWQPSGAHENLPIVSAVEKTYRLVHFAKSSELDAVVENFKCRNGAQKRTDLGLVLVINSWGAGIGNKLAKRYTKECGREVDYVVLVDGVAKPIGAYSRSFPARNCTNFYQTRGLVHGRAIKNCQNHNLTPSCEKLGLGPVECHIFVEWEGTARAQRTLENIL